MAWKSKKTIDTTTSIPLGRLARPSEISSYIKKLINASQYDYHESEAFEVTEVILNEPLNRGSVRGSFINNPNQEILGGVVKPLMPNVVAVPVIGEHVVVVEYNGQHYYTSIINRKGSVNENSIPGASGTYEKNTKYGKTFERQNVKPIQINEGDIVYVPLLKGYFEIQFVEDQEPFYQLGNLPVYKLKVTRWEYASEKLDTGQAAIDQAEDKYTLDQLAYKVTLEYGQEALTGKGSIMLEDYHDYSTGQPAFLMHEDYATPSIQTQSPYAGNLDLNTEAGYDTVDTADDILDFTERNPFGEVDE